MTRGFAPIFLSSADEEERAGHHVLAHKRPRVPERAELRRERANESREQEAEQKPLEFSLRLGLRETRAEIGDRQNPERARQLHRRAYRERSRAVYAEEY